MGASRDKRLTQNDSLHEGMKNSSVAIRERLTKSQMEALKSFDLHGASHGSVTYSSKSLDKLIALDLVAYETEIDDYVITGLGMDVLGI